MKKKWYQLVLKFTPHFIFNWIDFGRYKNWECKAGYISSTNEPLVCYNCNHTKFKEKITDTLDGHTVMEKELYCLNCEKLVGYWSYGNWMI